MKFGVIDIGSNSVRLMMSDGEKTLCKKVKTTRLAEGMGVEAQLKAEPIERTANAVSFFKQIALNDGASNVCAFATASVRQAVNSKDFTDRVKELCGLDVDVISGEKEARLGAKGALNGKDGAIIDVGGASTEINVINNGKSVYCKSINLGVVKIKDAVGQEYNAVSEFVEDKITQFGDIPKCDLFGIGGTATSLAGILLELEPYDPEKTDGYFISIERLEQLVKKLFGMTEEQKRNLKGLQPERAGVIAGGAMVIFKILKKIGANGFTVSEKDNLEGYLMEKLGK